MHSVWYGDGFDALIARAALTPFEWLYGAASAVHGAWRGSRAERPTLPTVSVGNITVGGTGKTPVAAWFAAQLRVRGMAPAVLLRGYGDDEARVHARLNPDVPVFANADRRASAALAATGGARSLVLDDAFQHRQMPRHADIVLVSADVWHEPPRLLPAGPFRESPTALRRADLIIVTRKAASAERAAAVAAQLARIAAHVPVAVMHLALDGIVSWTRGADAAPLEALRGQRVLAVCGIGAPDAFFSQLRGAGAVVDGAAFGDHHAYDAQDVRTLAARAATADRVVCTLKDAVKLGPLWPAVSSELWYLSQSIVVETGSGNVEALLDRLVHTMALPTPAPTGPASDSHG